MKKDLEMKFPSAAELFQFCRKVLDFKYGGARVIDQDVGQLLGFDPADCSHWKKGKKNVKSIQAIRTLSDSLGVDEGIISDLAFGGMTQNEAFNEFQGYGRLDLDSKALEEARKEAYRLGGMWDKNFELEIMQAFHHAILGAEAIAQSIHEKIIFKEAPLFLQEISQYYPKIQFDALSEQSDSSLSVIFTESDEGIFKVSIAGGKEIKAFTRFLTAKALGHYFLKEIFNSFGFLNTNATKKLESEIKDILVNRFAVYLLAPTQLIIQQIAKADPGRNLINQLAENFWISKVLMNMRLRNMMIDLASRASTPEMNLL